MLPGQAEPQHYAKQLAEKSQKSQVEFQEFSPPSLEVFSSPAKHYRMRAEFKVWHEKGQASYAMYQPGEYKKPVLINAFSIGHQRICELMPPLMKAINENELLLRKLFQIEFLCTTNGEALVTFIYHKPLDESWQTLASELEQNLNCHIIGRSRKQKIVISQDFVSEKLSVNGVTYHYTQFETGFTQPNASVCVHMLEWAQNVSHGLEGDLLELYCGNGNFTLPLAKNFRKVLATEVSKLSIRAARQNISDAGADNITLLRMSSEEFTQAIKGVRPFRRLKDIDLQEYNFSTVFVDPPRAGLDVETVALVSGFDNILYISCKPETLKSNLLQLNGSHKITRFALFDQFPYTDHRECGVLLQKK